MNKNSKKSKKTYNPKRRNGSFKELIRVSSNQKGEIDLREMEREEGRYGSNGGRGCDVSKGPCSCGAWH